MKKEWNLLLFMALIPLAFGLYSLSLGQDTNWDIQNYHLYNPYAFLHGRFNQDLSPAGWCTCLNPYLDLAYFELTQVFSPRTVGFILGLVQGLNVIFLFFICKNCLKATFGNNDRSSLVLAIMGGLSVGFLSEIGTVFWDNVVSIFILISLFMVVRSIDDMVSGRREVIWPIVCAGVLAGIGAGLKLTVSLNAFALMLSFFFISVPWGTRTLYAFLFGLGTAAGLLGSDGYWLWYIWQHMGNPIYPFMNNIFHSALAPLAPIHDLRFHPKNFFEMLAYPYIFTLDPLRAGEQACKQLNWLIVYFVSIFFFVKQIIGLSPRSVSVPLSHQAKYLLSFFWISYFFWLITFGYYRYQISIEILIPLVIVVLFSSLFKLDRLKALTVVILLGSVTLFNLGGVADWGHSKWGTKVYRLDSRFVLKDKFDAVALIGLPLGWVVPALDIDAPFIQLMPNFLVSEAYFQKARAMLRIGNRKVLVIFQPWVISPKNARAVLKPYDLELKKGACSMESGYIGSKRIYLMFCRAYQ